MATRFSAPVQNSPCPLSFLHEDTGFSFVGHDKDYPYLSSGEVTERAELYLYPPPVPYGMLQGEIYIYFTCHQVTCTTCPIKLHSATKAIHLSVTIYVMIFVNGFFDHVSIECKLQAASDGC